MKNLKDNLINEELTISQANSRINKFVREIDKFMLECQDCNVNAAWALGRILKGLGKKNWDVDFAIKYYEK